MFIIAREIGVSTPPSVGSGGIIAGRGRESYRQSVPSSFGAAHGRGWLPQRARGKRGPAQLLLISRFMNNRCEKERKRVDRFPSPLLLFSVSNRAKGVRP